MEKHLTRRQALAGLGAGFLGLSGWRRPVRAAGRAAPKPTSHGPDRARRASYVTDSAGLITTLFRYDAEGNRLEMLGPPPVHDEESSSEPDFEV